jgi:hypothetical protein
MKVSAAQFREIVCDSMKVANNQSSELTLCLLDTLLNSAARGPLNTLTALSDLFRTPRRVMDLDGVMSVISIYSSYCQLDYDANLTRSLTRLIREDLLRGLGGAESRPFEKSRPWDELGEEVADKSAALLIGVRNPWLKLVLNNVFSVKPEYCHRLYNSLFSTT